MNEFVCNVKVSLPIKHLMLPAAFNCCRFKCPWGRGETKAPDYDAINLLSAIFFSKEMKGLIYADIIAISVNYLKNLKTLNLVWNH